jgi:hypothetical protein
MRARRHNRNCAHHHRRSPQRTAELCRGAAACDTAKPADEDMPGMLASKVRRARAVAAVDHNQMSFGL